MGRVTGATLMARNLKRQGVDYMFGIVGFAVQPIALAALEAGIKFLACATSNLRPTPLRLSAT